MTQEIMPSHLLLLISISLGILATAAVLLVLLLFRVLREARHATTVLADVSRAVIDASRRLGALTVAATTTVEKSEDALATFQQAGDLFLVTAQQTKAALTPLFDQLAGLVDALRPKAASPAGDSSAPGKQE